MNKLLFRSFAALRLTSATRRFPLVPSAVRFFTTQTATQSQSIHEIVNNFYARGEAEEINVGSIARTMNDLLRSNITYEDHKEYNPISEELAYYVIKLLQQHKRPFVSHQHARIFLDFGTTFDIQERDYWKLVQQSLLESIPDMRPKELLSLITHLKNTNLLTNAIV